MRSRFIFIALFALLLAVTGCGRSSPLLSQEELPSTPTPTTSSDGPPTPIIPLNPRDTFDQAKQFIKLAEWNENSIKFSNALAGYIIRHGYSYPVDVVVTTPDEYKAALLSGEVQVVMEFPKDTEAQWYEAQIAAGTIKDIGTLFEGQPNKRIVIQSAVAGRAPEVVAFLRKYVPGDAKHAELSGRIVGGRGFSPEAAAQLYYKENPDIWPSWTGQAEAALVRAAIAAGNNAYKPTGCYKGQQAVC